MDPGQRELLMSSKRGQVPLQGSIRAFHHRLSCMAGR
jgi:hypothetical protein